eukprot:gene7909-16193_t
MNGLGLVNVVFDFQSCTEVISTGNNLIPFDPNAVPEGLTNSSYIYGGKHDHGSLPTLKNDGHYPALISAITEAKAECDRLLTGKISKDATVDIALEDMDNEDSELVAATKKSRVE